MALFLVPLTRASLFCHLQQCLQKKDVATGRRLHGFMLVAGLDSLSCLSDHLIRLFSASDDTLLDASTVFCNISDPSPHSWHAIISAHSGLEHFDIALQLYRNMLVGSVSHPLSATVLLALRSVSCTHALSQGRIMHHHICENSFDADNSIASTLIFLYARCGSLAEAHTVFELIGNKTKLSWNILITSYVRCEQCGTALELFAKMQNGGVTPDQVTLSCVLKACSMCKDVDQGMHIHQWIVNAAHDSHLYVANSLVDMYAKTGYLEDAKHVFFKLPDRGLVLHNTMISGYVFQGHGYTALDSFMKMQEEGMIPDSTTWSCILKACGDISAINEGNVLHTQLVENLESLDTVVYTSLIDMYLRCRKVEDAHRMFARADCQNKVAWYVMITGCVQQNVDVLALQLFKEMLARGMEPDDFMFSCILKACGSTGAAKEGKLLHNQIVMSGIDINGFIGSAIIDMYNKCGILDDGIKVFNGLRSRDVIDWSTIIAGHMQHERHLDCLQLFERMHQECLQPDKYIFSCMLEVYASLRSIEQGKHVHGMIIKRGMNSDDILWVSLVDMYAKCGRMQEANWIFHRLKERNMVAWGALIAGYALHGDIDSAFEFFDKMQEEGLMPDLTLMQCLLKTCTSSRQVKWVHGQIVQNGFVFDVGMSNTLMDTYQKNGSLSEARKVFDAMPRKDVVSWNTVIAGYVEHGLNVAAFELYEKMQQEGVEWDAFTFSCLLKACWQMAAVDIGNLMYEQIIRKNLDTDVIIQRALIEMYSRCDSLKDAEKVFYCIPAGDASLWDAIITAHTQCCDLKVVADLLHKMQEEGLKPDDSTHTNVLAAYTRSGQFEDGQSYYKTIKECSFARTNIKHFNCAIDLLGRSGHVREAEELLHTMPIPPDVISLTSLLSSCRTHSNGRTIQSSKHVKLEDRQGSRENNMASCG